MSCLGGGLLPSSIRHFHMDRSCGSFSVILHDWKCFLRVSFYRCLWLPCFFFSFTFISCTLLMPSSFSHQHAWPNHPSRLPAIKSLLLFWCSCFYGAPPGWSEDNTFPSISHIYWSCWPNVLLVAMCHSHVARQGIWLSYRWVTLDSLMSFCHRVRLLYLSIYSRPCLSSAQPPCSIHPQGGWLRYPATWKMCTGSGRCYCRCALG